MSKLIAIDLDGTVLNSNKEISDYTKQTFSESTKYNNMVVIATGRSYHGAIQYYNHLKLKTPLITLNGALITMPDGTQIKRKLSKKIVEDLYNDLNQYFLSAFFNCVDKGYAINHSTELEELFNGGTIDEIIDFDLKKISKDDVLNVIVSIKPEHKEAFENYFEGKQVEHRHWFTNEEFSIYDLYLKGVSKASALKVVLDQHGMSKKDLISFGDGPNDLEMLSFANDGIAMLNGHELTKQSAKYITDYDNDNDGVARYLIKHYI